MGIYDRPYMQTEQRTGGPGGYGGVRLAWPKPGPVVKWLLILNIGIYVVQLIASVVATRSGWSAGDPLAAYFGVTVGGFWQVWRYITFQFLHSTRDIWHLPLNLLGIYMLGTPLERQWGSRRFLKFYLSCGVAAGVLYAVIAGIVRLPRDFPLIGASGGVFGVILACAVLFPQFRLILILFPVPIRLAAIIIFSVMGLVILRGVASGVYGGSFWSHIAHLGGTVMAAIWIWGVPAFGSVVTRGGAKARAGAWQRKMRKLADEQAEIDHVLHKIHEEGIHSLSAKEKRILREATRKQQRSEKDLFRL